MSVRAAFLLGLLILAGCGRKPAPHVRGGPLETPAFWVWHRTSALQPSEESALGKAGVRTLYWQTAECAWTGKGWDLNPYGNPLSSPAARIVPVFRLKPESAFLAVKDAPRELAERIRTTCGSPGEVQIDFDCPDRLLGGYAWFLRQLGRELAPTEVSITALAAWPRRPEFDQLADAVSSLAPMFYDLEADDPAEAKAERFQPMVPGGAETLIGYWKDCPKPWRAGLANFERLSVFEADGRLLGHLRGWVPDTVFFHPEFKRRELGRGVTLFETQGAKEWSGTRLAPGMRVVHRAPELAALSRLAAAADRAGAVGVVYFLLPGPGVEAAFSVSQLAHPEQAANPVVEVGPDGSLVLENPGPADLPSRLWELEIVSKHPGVFRSASPGQFAEMTPRGGVSPEIAVGMVLRFSKLPAGQRLVSGRFVGRAEGLTWSLRGLTEKQAVVVKDSAR